MTGCMLLGNSVIQACRTPATQQLSQYWLLDRLPVICLSSHHPFTVHNRTMSSNINIFLLKRNAGRFEFQPIYYCLHFIFPLLILQCMPYVFFCFKCHQFFIVSFKSNLSDKPARGRQNRVNTSGWWILTLWQRTLKTENIIANTVYAPGTHY